MLKKKPGSNPRTTLYTIKQYIATFLKQTADIEDHKMDWWCLGIIVCSAVFVTLCSASEGTLHDDYDATPGTHMFDADECPPNTIFCLFSSRCVNLDGSCIVPPTCKQGEVLQENRLGVYRCVTVEYKHVNEPEHCKEGQIFCIQERRCVNMDGTCPAEPTCGQYQMLCNRDGTLTCVEDGSCSHVEAGFYLEQADYNAVVGETYEHLKDFKDHVKQLLSKKIPKSEVNDFYDMSVERGSIDIRLSASSRLLDYFINMMTSRIQFMTDLQGEHMTINYDKSYAEFKKGYHVDCTDNTCTSCPVGQKYDVMHSGCVSVLEDQLPDYEGMHGGQKKCKLGMIFCLQARRCVNLDGTCDDEPSCDTHQVMCKTDRGLMCVDHGKCNYAEVIIYVDNTDFNAVIGPDFENMKGFIGHFKKDLLAKVPGAMDTDVWNFETTSGSIVIEFFMSSQFYSRLMELKQSDSQFISNFNEHSLHIDWEKSSAHIHTAYHQDFYTECQDEHCITCPWDSVIDWNMKSCVIYDNVYDEEKGDDSFGDHKDHDGMNGGFTCGYNEIFCIEAMRCVTENGYCPLPDCGSSQKVCYKDGAFQCAQSCLYAKFVISMDGNFFDIVGRNYENYNSVKNTLTQQLAAALGVEQNDIIETYLWNGSLNFGGKMAHELKSKLELVIHGDKSLNLNLDGKLMNINYDKSAVYEETEYGDESYDDDDDSQYKDDEPCPECRDDGIRCGMGEVFCIESGGCVKTDGSCIDEPQECPYDGEVPCNDGYGGFTCKPFAECEDNVNTIQTAEFSLTLHGNFDEVIGLNKGKAIQELQITLQAKFGTPPGVLTVMDVKNGSIVVSIEIYASVEEIKGFITKLEMFVNNMETVELLGHVLPVESFEVLNEHGIHDKDGGDKDHGGDDHSGVSCSNGLVFCIETGECVSPDGECVDNNQCENPVEVPCNDGFGGFTCKPYTECEDNTFTTATTEVSLTLQGNFDEVIGQNKENAIKELQIILPAKFGTAPGVLTVMDVMSGSIVVIMEIHAAIEEIKEVIRKLELLVNNKESVELSGHVLAVESFEILKDHDETNGGNGGHSDKDDDDERSITCEANQLFCFETRTCVSENECSEKPKPLLCSEVDEIFCPGKGLCVPKTGDLSLCMPNNNECNETHARCYDLGNAETAKCVPKQTCHVKSFCPIPQQESVSTCQATCNPKEDGENSDGQICCPNSCGGENGGVYMDPLSYYVCPRDEETGLCQIQPDTKCVTGTIFCPALDKCVGDDYDFATCQPEVTVCNEKQSYCLDAQGFVTCVPADTCTIRSIKIKMATDADFDTMIAKETEVIAELTPQLIDALKIDPNILKHVELFPGSLGILVTLSITDPMEAESTLAQLETLVQESKLTFMILGSKYLINPDSFKVGVDLVVFEDTDCKTTENCLECGDGEASCTNLDGTKSVICVPSHICRVESACQLPVKDVFSKCQIECDPRQDKKRSDGKLCCPNACGGESSGVYVEPVTRYVCPVDEDSGMCLTEADTKCETGKEWCSATFSCETDDDCSKQGLQQNVDDVTKSDRYIVRIPLVTKGLKFIKAFAPKDATATLQQEVEKFANLMKGKLLKTLQTADTDVTIERVAVYPEKIDTRTFSVYADVLCKTLTASDIMEKVVMLLSSLLGTEEFSLEQGNHPSVTAVLGPQSDQIFIARKPLVAGTDTMLGLLNVVLGTMFTSVPVKATLDCSETEGVDVVAGNTASPINDISSDQEFAIRHKLTEMQLVKCELLSSQLKNIPDGVAVYIGFIALPKDIGKLGTVTDIELLQEQIQTDEDNDCIGLPDNLFKIKHEGDKLFELLYDYPAKMTGNNEMWVGSVSTALQEQFIRYVITRETVLRNIRVTVSIATDSTGSRPAKLLYKGDPLRETDVTNLLSSEDSLKALEICVRPDYSGVFNLDITESVGLLGTPGRKIEIPVLVNGKNDAPELTRKSDLPTGFTYPMVPTGDDIINVPKFNVKELMELLADDTDDDDLGMAVVGVTSNKIDGTWEYSRDEGSTWETLVPMDTVPKSEQINHNVILLHPTDYLRFTVSESHKKETWLLDSAPKIAVLAWDGFKDDSTMKDDTVSLEICDTFETGIQKYCYAGTKSTYSKDMVQFSLPRAGCDGEPNSGKEMMQCGCGDDRSCLDCFGEPNGDAQLDECGICGGTNNEVNCDVEECKQIRKDYCERQEEFSDSMSEICLEGETLNSEHIDTCGFCIAKGTVIKEDQCGVPCGNDDCLDCAGEKGLYAENTCGDCKPIAQLNENCGSDAIKIGNIHPPTSVPWAVMNITVNVSGLPENDSPDISECLLEPKEEREENAGAPVVTKITYIANKPSIILTIQAKPFTGLFGISCTINGQTASTKDNDQYLHLHNYPVLTSVDPVKSLISDIGDITITGSGFLDTGLVICVRPCLSDEACAYKDAKGKRINDAQVICPAKRLLTRKRGQTYNIYVVLQKLQTVDIESLFKTPGVQFSVVLPAPSAVSAVLDKYGCPKLIVTFSTKVIGTSGDSCGDYFTAPTLIDDEDKCLLPKGSNRMLIEFKTPIEAGGDLIFKPGVISSAAEHHTDDQLVEKLTGSVTVTNDDTEEKGKPIVKIDSQTMKKVGCSPVTVKLKIRNLRCWDIVVNWIVSATGADAAHVTSLQEKLGTSTSFTITGSDLQEGVPYTFTAKWTAGKYSGEDSTTIIKDSDSTAAVKIRGIMEDDTDINEALVIKAKLSLCDGDKSIPAITWSLTPPDYSLEPKFMTFIPKGQLKPRTQYNLTCKVTRDGASEINRFVAFKTRPLPIKPLIETNTVRPTYDDTVTLTCSDMFDTAADKSDYEYSWSCNDNVITGTEDENDFRPCFEYSDADQKYIPIERSGHTISLGKSDRMQPRNGLNLIQIWTCEMRRKSEMDLIYRSSQKLEFSEELIQLQVPEIDSKTPEMIYLSEDDSFVVKIHAKVRKGTGCKWWTNDMDDRSEASENILLDPTNFRISGRLGKENIKYSETSYEMCHMKLNLHDANLIPAQRYVLKLFAYNKDSKFLVLNSREFKVMVVPHPKPGIIKIEAEDDTIIALKTKVRILLSGWQDDLNDAALQCNFYYTDLDSQVKQIRRMNTVPINIDEQKETTLAEGRNKIEVECCNIFNKCSRKEADEIITADPIDQEEVLNVIGTTLPQLLSLDTEGVLSFVAELKKSMKKKVVDVVKKENAEKSLKQAMQKAIKRAFETARDITSKLSALQQTVDVVDSPADLDESAKEDVKQNVKAILEEAVGTDKRRKRRSTTETSKPKGLTATAASIGLKALDSLISKETITQEDANFFKTVVDEVMVAMCINFTGSEPWLAPAELSYVRLHKTNLDGYASIQSDVSCSTCPEVDYPAKVNYGSYLEAYFNDSWQCTFYDKCIDVCVATAQINIDYVTLTAETEVVAPTRRSDIIILKMISPENYAVEELTSLSTPIETTLTINGTIDLDKYDYKCLMWVSDNWSDQQCNITTPSVDLTASQHTAICSCNALGIISIFQEVKQEQVVTTTTQSTTTSTTTVVSSSKDTNKVSSTNTPPPSKQMKDSTTSVKVEFTFEDDYDTSVGNSVSAFNNKVKEDIVTGTEISSNCIKNFKSEKGSIVITFELQQAGSSLTLGQIVYKVENAIKTNAITFTTPSGGSLSIKADSFEYEEVDDDDGDKDGDKDGDGNESENLPIIIGAALGGLVIVSVTIIVILLILKSKKKRTHPTRSVSDGPTPRYATPPPTYSVTQPPPPYLYEDPPKVNKWIEDELNETKVPLDNQRPPSSGSGGSGSSYEQKLKKKGRECGPTPVGE